MTSIDLGRSRTLGDREFIFFMAFLSAMSALAIDMLLPAFSDMRPAFGLASDSTELSLTITLFFVGSGIGQLFYGPIADSVGRKPVLLATVGLYALAALVAALAPSLAVLYGARFVWGLAAAGPRVLSQAIVRDRYAGDAMARVMTLIQTAFFLAPVLAPVLGQGLVSVGSWRWVMGFGVISALVLVAWSSRLEETLVVENRRPLQLRSTSQGFRLVFANRVTLGYLLSVTFAFGAFYSFLGSSELLFDSVFDRADLFVPYFSTIGVLFAGVALTSNRLLRRLTGAQLALRAGSALVLVSASLLVACLIFDGVPPFALFIVLFTVANGCHVAFFPTASSLALEPMGALAGTAAAALGFTTAIVGAGLGSLIDRAIDGTATPIALGYTVYGIAALGAQLFARANRPSSATPEAAGC